MKTLLLMALAALICFSTAYASVPVPKAAAARGQSGVSFRHLTCEYLDDPEGIDVTVPRLSWQEASPETGYRQTAYRVVVASSAAKLAAGQGDLWDSGRVPSARTTLIPYGGVRLTSRRRCWWAVQAWDGRGRRSAWSAAATFSLGLLSPSDWKASWIGRGMALPMADLSSLAGARWVWFPDGGQPSDAAPLGTRFFRTVVTVPNGRAIKRAVFVGTADNAFTLSVNGHEAGGGDYWYTAQALDVTRWMQAGPNALAVEARNVGAGGPNPAGLIGALTITYADGGEKTVVTTGPPWKTSQTASDGWKTAAFDDSAWQTALDLGVRDAALGDLSQNEAARHPPLPARYLRREFAVRPRLVRATAFVCGLGFYQLFFNGRPATNHVMDPALSDYTKADYYVTADVTALIRPGQNAVGAVLGNGRFYAPRLSVPIATGDYGVPRLLFQLELTYADGTHQTLVSDHRWQVTDRGPIRENNEYDGETYDARLAMPGWAQPGFAAHSPRWTPADLLKAPGGTLKAQMLEPMRVTAVVPPSRLSSPRKGMYEVDMGRTFYGTVRLTAQAPRATTVRMTSAYALLPDGTLKTADNRSALATDIYTFAGQGQETWNPVFKGQGFRRVQVTGFPGKPALSNFAGLDEHSDTRPVGQFACSSGLVNRIHDAMRTGMTMFLRSAPLDPDRDERQAWMGDPAKDSESEAFNFDVAAFYTKWMDDVRESQRSDGSIPDVAMYWNMGSGVEWPSVFTIIPDWYTGFYADDGVERKNYDAMKRWVLAMQRQHVRPDGTLEATSYGDWCDTYTIGGHLSDFGQTPRDLISTAYQYHNARIVQQAAERLGQADDALQFRTLADGLSAAFLAKFYDPATHTFTGATQCSYVLPLAFGLLPSDPAQRPAIIDNLVQDIEVTHQKHLTVGLIGNQWLLQVLTDCGRADVAWDIVTQTTRPSWGYMVGHGNTIWERWDYDTRDPGMNSESLLIQAGNVDAWFYQTLAGINYDPAHPGFSHILIHPHILGDLTWVRCRFDSPHGLIVSDWTRTGQRVTLHVTIPANTTATVTTPDGHSRELVSGDWTLKSRLEDPIPSR